MNAKELGIFSGCLELGIPHHTFREYQGFHEVWDRSQTKQAAAVVKSIYQILDGYGITDTDAYTLTKAASKKYDAGEWDFKCQAVADGIYDLMGRLDHVKQAGIAPTAALGMKSLLALSAATGIGAGALYWTLKRDAEQDAAPNEDLRNKIDYYRSMAKDLESSIGRRMEGSAAEQIV